MFRQAFRILVPVVMVLSLTLGALAWSASSVAFAAGQPGQSATMVTATPAPVYSPLLPYNAAWFGPHGSRVIDKNVEKDLGKERCTDIKTNGGAC